MVDRTLARRYAKAFLELAQEAKLVDQLGSDLANVIEVMGMNDGLLLHVLSNPVFTREERSNVLSDLLPKLELHDLTSNLLSLLVDRSRIAALPEIVRLYKLGADDHAGRLRIKVSTAEPLTPHLEIEVRTAFERVTGKQVVLETSVEPELIAGMVARIGSKVYDSSLKTRLKDIKHSLLSAQVAAEA